MMALRALFAAAAVVVSSAGAARAQAPDVAHATAPDASRAQAPDAGTAQSGEATARPEAGAMTVSLLEGAATATRAGKTAEPLATGAVLHEGDVVETAPGGRAEISFASGTLLRIGESSRVELREAPPQGGAFRARLLLGNLWAKVHKLVAGERFEVETENAVAGVRGTEFRVESTGGKSEDLVRVYEGAVEVKAHQGRPGAPAWSHRVEPSRELRFSRGKAPSGPAAFDAASEARHPFMSWVRARTEARGAVAPGMKPGASPGQRRDDKKTEPRDDKKKREPKDELKHDKKADAQRELERDRKAEEKEERKNDGKREDKKDKDEEKHEKKRRHG